MKAEGKCLTCARPRARGRSVCNACFGRQWRAKRRAEGKCLQCPARTEAGSSRCRSCLDQVVRRNQSRLGKLKAKGRCACGRLSAEGRTCCSRCLEKARIGSGIVFKVSCDTCGVVFLRSKYRASRSSACFCSPECASVGKIKGRVLRTCGHCGTSLSLRERQITRGKKFCSRACKTEHSRTRPDVTCEQCGGVKTRRAEPQKYYKRFCSKRCYGGSLTGRPAGPGINAARTRGHFYPHSSIEEVANYLIMKGAIRKVEQCLTQTK